MIDLAIGCLLSFRLSGNIAAEFEVKSALLDNGGLSLSLVGTKVDV